MPNQREFPAQRKSGLAEELAFLRKHILLLAGQLEIDTTRVRPPSELLIDIRAKVTQILNNTPRG